MKKTIAAFLVVLMALFATAPLASAAKASSRPTGGIAGFLVGCCIGPRAAASYNSGKDLHWTEWARIIPYVGWVVGILNGIEAFNGMGTADMVKTYGSQYY